MKITNILFIIAGFISLCIGCIGIVLPILPTVTFFLITTFCFAKSSERLHKWFIGTNMYKKHLQSYVEKRGMLVKTKAAIIASVTILMTIGFIMMNNTIIGRIILTVVWAAHIIYFIFGVKTLKVSETLPD